MPTANRNSYRVARLVGAHTQGSGLARNPGLGNRNSFRVAAAYDGFVMEGIMFVCMDVGVAAAYVVFVMRDMLFVSMDVGVAAGGHPRISQGEGVLSKRLKHTKYELPPLGEG